jgi:transposase
MLDIDADGHSASMTSAVRPRRRRPSNLLRNWMKAFEADPQDAFRGQGRMKPEQAEIERLRREVQRLKAERDILKKAAAYFAKESNRAVNGLAAKHNEARCNRGLTRAHGSGDR